MEGRKEERKGGRKETESEVRMRRRGGSEEEKGETSEGKGNWKAKRKS